MGKCLPDFSSGIFFKSFCWGRTSQFFLLVAIHQLSAVDFGENFQADGGSHSHASRDA